MTEHEALAKARKRAKATERTYFVVWSVEDMDRPGQHYHTATDEDLEWFYSGCDPVYAVEPDGMIS